MSFESSLKLGVIQLFLWQLIFLDLQLLKFFMIAIHKLVNSINHLNKLSLQRLVPDQFDFTVEILEECLRHLKFFLNKSNVGLRSIFLLGNSSYYEMKSLDLASDLHMSFELFWEFLCDRHINTHFLLLVVLSLRSSPCRALSERDIRFSSSTSIYCRQLHRANSKWSLCEGFMKLPKLSFCWIIPTMPVFTTQSLWT